MKRPSSAIAAACALAATASSADNTPVPGRWRFTRTFVEISLPGVPSSATRRHLGVPRLIEQCVTANTARDFYGLAIGSGCSLQRQQGTGNTFSATYTCGADRLEGGGTLTATRLTAVIMKTNPDGTFMKATLTGQRIGQCAK